MPHRCTRPRLSFLAVLCLLLPGPAGGQEIPTGLPELRDLVEERALRIAQSGLEEYLASHPRDGEAWELLGRAREGRWLFEEAAEAYEQALRYRGESSELLMRYVITRGRSLNILSAIFQAARLRDMAARALELDPMDTEARAVLAAYYAVLPGIVGGDRARAERIVEELVELSPADGYTLQGFQAAEQGLPDSVKVNRWEAALRADPGHTGALLALGLHWIGQDSAERAMDYYARAARADPDDPQVWLSFGRAWRRLDRNERAAEHFRTALGLDPFFAPARFALAEYYQEHGQRQEAIRAYSRLAVNNPTYESKTVRRRLRELRHPR
ncbi:MAG: tetratricopeptide repeat protein [bacterium]